jgi:virginiamycin B lyase
MPPPNTATLRVDVEGLPAGVAAKVTVTDANGMAQSVTMSVELTVPAGVYRIAADPVTSGGVTYGVRIEGSPATLAAGDIGFVAAVYARPGSSDAGPGADAQLTGTDAQPVGADAQPSGTDAQPSMADAGATDGAPPSDGGPTTGALAIVVSGLPMGTTGSVQIAGPGGPYFVVVSQILSGLMPADYTVTAQNVMVGSNPYAAAVAGSPATVVAGQTSTVTVTYAIAPPAPVILQIMPQALGLGSSSTSGGDLLTIVTQNVAADSNPVVHFGTATATINAIVPGELRVTVPPHVPGDVDITITTLGGTTTPTTSDRWSYFELHSFTVPTPNCELYGLTFGPDGNLWFTEQNTPMNAIPKVGRMTPGGMFAEFPLPTNARPQRIVSGPDGNLWFTEEFANAIGRVTPTGTVTHFPIAPTSSQPTELTVGPDGAIWYVQSNPKIGRMTTSGMVSEFNISTTAAGITTGPDGNLWWSDFIGNQIAKMTTQGMINEFGGGIFYPRLIIAGRDGNVWFADDTVVRLGRITPTGTITVFSGNAGGLVGGSIWGLAVAPDGNIWTAGGHEVARTLASGFTTSYVIGGVNDSVYGIAPDPSGGRQVWFVNANQNTVVRLDY